MEIIDMNGKPIEVTDLDKAIEIAEAYKDNAHLDKSYYQLDQRLQQYWTDIYQQLLQLKSDNNHKKTE